MITLKKQPLGLCPLTNIEVTAIEKWFTKMNIKPDGKGAAGKSVKVGKTTFEVMSVSIGHVFKVKVTASKSIRIVYFTLATR
jgi:hypothetical protein